MVATGVHEPGKGSTLILPKRSLRSHLRELVAIWGFEHRGPEKRFVHHKSEPHSFADLKFSLHSLNTSGTSTLLSNAAT